MWWLSVFAALAVVALLFAFQRVVHAAVDKAQVGRIQQSQQAQALWQCQWQAAGAERRACMSVRQAGASALPHSPQSLVVTAAR